MVWVLLGPLAVIIGKGYNLDAAQIANLVALPVLGGSILRLVLGYMTDRIGPKLSGQIGLGLTLVPLLVGWQFANSMTEIYFVALMLGIAGALPLARIWYPRAAVGKMVVICM
jgi:NNP family nitrate/nitrite transporter-like MFS transporter